jgi:hypothetical protein
LRKDSKVHLSNSGKLGRNRNMTKKVLTSLLILAFALTNRPVAPGQTNTTRSQPAAQDWQDLRDVKPGKILLVETKQGRMIEAKFVDVAGSKLALSHGFDILVLEQRDLQRVYLQTGSSRRKKAIIGAVLGGIVGLVIGAKVGAGIDAREAGPPFQDALTPGGATAIYLMLGGAALGYGIGHQLGGKRKGKLLYESK